MAVWVVRAGGKGEEEPTALGHNVVTIAWNEFGDLSEKSRKELDNLYRRTWPKASNRHRGIQVGQIWSFLSEDEGIKQDDLVILPLLRMQDRGKTRFFAIGKILGSYRYSRLSRQVHHTRPVRWFFADIPMKRLKSTKLRAALGIQKTVYQIHKPSGAEETFLTILRKESERRFRVIRTETPVVEADNGAKCGRRYPWKKWFAKKKVVLYQGQDFNGRCDTMAMHVRQVARKHGRSVSIAIDEDRSCLTIAWVD